MEVHPQRFGEIAVQVGREDVNIQLGLTPKKKYVTRWPRPQNPLSRITSSTADRTASYIRLPSTRIPRAYDRLIENEKELMHSIRTFLVENGIEYIAALRAKVADGVVVGSALVSEVAEHADEAGLAGRIEERVRELRSGIG